MHQRNIRSPLRRKIIKLIILSNFFFIKYDRKSVVEISLNVNNYMLKISTIRIIYN